VQEVPGSNPGGPTKVFIQLQTRDRPEACFGVQVESKFSISVVGTVAGWAISSLPRLSVFDSMGSDMGSVGSVFCCRRLKTTTFLFSIRRVPSPPKLQLCLKCALMAKSGQLPIQEPNPALQADHLYFSFSKTLSSPLQHPVRAPTSQLPLAKY
jgi:hypothetical protein